jgi:Mor family transcriptional regulator
MNLDWESVELEHLPQHFQEIGRDLGIDVVKYLIEMWGGSVIYVPTLSKLAARHLQQIIRSEYDGTNERTLARKYGLSRSRIRRLLYSN